MDRIAVVILALFTVTACTTAGRRRPPEGYVATPHGFVHSSCVRHVPEGHRVRADGTIVRPTGERETLPPCAYPRLHSKTLRPVAEAQPPDVNGWVEYAGWTSSVPLGSLVAKMAVPQPPASNGALIYFFPGSEPDDGSTILQPVLQYGDGAAGGGNYWAVASWFCCPSGWTTHSSLLQVNPGDTIVGTMTAVCSGSNCNWTIVTADASSTSATTLHADGVTTPFVWNFAGVLEAYGVTDCSQYPAGGALAFTAVTLLDTSGHVMQPSWSPTVLNPTPSCNYGVTVNSPSSVTVRY